MSNEPPKSPALPTVGADAPLAVHVPREQEGQMIGRYKLLQPIGEGGFGSVWMAEQREPVKRRVALKIIKLGMDTKQVIARFEAERQALAMMDHPNIAKVLDAGSTETGRPYFVMEYIKGVPILEYCDTERLDTRARLDLFTSVCHAIQHAHQKGIIHRDIKPTNVLVTLHDGVPVPKVIDFGIAKATNTELTQKTLFTAHRQMIGTPAYMSPEQAEMSGLDIDTRSDIYSLGVLLYELLTGTTPFGNDELMSKGFAEMLRIIREEEPHKPSTRLSSLGDTGTRTALERHATDPKKLGLVLKGDLDWIVMKCLEKDRARRYETANGLAADIQRHLRDEPVAAGPPSARYRLKKFIKRNKAQVIAAVVVTTVLLLGVVGTTRGMMRALREKENSQRELARATEIKQLIRDMLKGVKPEVAQTTDTTLLKKILGDTAARLSKNEITDELVAADLHYVVAEVYDSLGLNPEAETHYRAGIEIRKRVLGKEDRIVLAMMMNLGLALTRTGRNAEAESLWSKALEMERRVLGEEDEITLGTFTNLANLYSRSGRTDDALRMFETSLPTMRRVLGLGHNFTSESLMGLAGLYQKLGRSAEAKALCIDALEEQKRTLGEDHRETLRTMNYLGVLYGTDRQFAEAEPLFLKAFEDRRRVLGAGHPETLESMNNLASVYGMQNRIAEVESLFVKIVDFDRRVHGAEQPETADAMIRLADLYRTQGRWAEAEPLYVEATEIRRRMFGVEHKETLNAMHSLPIVYGHLGRFAEAEKVGLELLELDRRVKGEEHEDTLGTITNLGHGYLASGRYEDAARMFEKSLPVKRRVLGIEHPWTQVAMQGLVGAYMHLGRREEAIPLLRELLQMQTAAAEKPDATAQTLNGAAWMLLTHEIEELRDPAKALGYAQRACAVEEAAGSASLWMYLDTLALAQHRTGDNAAAVETQRRAISLAAGQSSDSGMPQRLAEYEAAQRGATGPKDKGSPP